MRRRSEKTLVRAARNHTVCAWILATATILSSPGPAAGANPNCPEFRNPATGACEPYVIPAPPPAAPAPAGSAAEHGFLNEVRPARLPYTDASILKLGYKVCQVFDPLMPGGDTAHQVADATGMSLAVADAFNFAALKYLCPKKYPYRS